MGDEAIEAVNAQMQAQAMYMCRMRDLLDEQLEAYQAIGAYAIIGCEPGRGSGRGGGGARAGAGAGAGAGGKVRGRGRGKGARPPPSSPTSLQPLRPQPARVRLQPAAVCLQTSATRTW